MNPVGLIEKYRNYKQSRNEKRIEKASASVCNPKAIKEDRQAAIDYLASIDDASLAVPALLKRFEFSLEHGINDPREK